MFTQNTTNVSNDRNCQVSYLISFVSRLLFDSASTAESRNTGAGSDRPEAGESRALSQVLAKLAYTCQFLVTPYALSMISSLLLQVQTGQRQVKSRAFVPSAWAAGRSPASLVGLMGVMQNNASGCTCTDLLCRVDWQDD
jgi:hypothetical protein